jgi:hypothetical protein
MKPIINQDNAFSFISNISSSVTDFRNKVITIKEGTQDALEVISQFCKIIITGVDWIKTILLNPIIILTAVDKLSIIILTTLILLKILGFGDLEKWILLTILIKVVAMILI